MSKFLQRGNSTGQGIAILAVLLILIITMPKGTPDSQNSTSSPSGTATRPADNNIISTTSPHTRSIFLNEGNARSAYQPSQEYISIMNSGREPIDITGWQVKNGKDKRTYYIGGSLQRFPADIAFIGQAAALLSPTGNNLMGNIVLGQGETAIITTGKMASQLPYPIPSFKENMCTGYLENMPEYSFTPQLNRNCPRPADEAGLEWLDTECRTFVSRLQSCQTPDFTPRNRQNEICNNCVNRTPLSGACVAFIKERFNYAGCVANHGNTENFSGRTWRVFLDRGWEMWAGEYETIEVLDQFGRPVTSRSF